MRDYEIAHVGHIGQRDANNGSVEEAKYKDSNYRKWIILYPFDAKNRIRFNNV